MGSHWEAGTWEDGVSGETLAKQTQGRKDHRTDWWSPDSLLSPYGQICSQIPGPSPLKLSTALNEVSYFQEFAGLWARLGASRCDLHPPGTPPGHITAPQPS